MSGLLSRLLRVPWTARRCWISSPSWRRSVLGVHYKDWCWSWNSNTLATWCEELTHLKRPWCWERLRAGGEGDDRGWDSWMASPIQWTWVWVNSGSWWWTGRPGVLQFMGSQRVGHDWVTELNWIRANKSFVYQQLNFYTNLNNETNMQFGRKVKVKSSVTANSLQPHGLQPTRLLCPWGFSRQEYWSGLPLPSPGKLGEGITYTPTLFSAFHIIFYLLWKTWIA